MKVSFILFTICILFINFVDGYFISQTMSEQIKNSLSNVFITKTNSITGIISAPKFGISHEETIITDDDNNIDDNNIDNDNNNIYLIYDEHNDNEIENFPKPKMVPKIKQKIIEKSGNLRGL